MPWVEQTDCHLGVAIADLGEVYHIGLVFRHDINRSTRTWHLLHHQVNFATSKDPMPYVQSGSHTRFWWTHIPVKPVDQQAMAITVRRIAKRLAESKIPFGMDHPYGAISQTGAVRTPAPFLNCATFVLAVLEASCRFQLLNLTTWQHRPDDEEYISKLFDHLKRSKAFDEAAQEAFKASCKHARVRASDVFAGCTLPVEQIPHCFEPTSLRFSEIEAQIRSAV